MDKEQLKKILEPVKKMCSLHNCNNCPFCNKDQRCSLNWRLIFGISHEVDNISESYIEILEKCIHEFCGRDSCRYCPRICTLNRFPAKWNFDELP